MDNFQKQMFNLGLNTFQTNRQDPQYFKINLDIPAPTPYPCCIIQPFRKREIKEKEKDVNPIMFVGEKQYFSLCKHLKIFQKVIVISYFKNSLTLFKKLKINTYITRKDNIV